MPVRFRSGTPKNLILDQWGRGWTLRKRLRNACRSSQRISATNTTPVAQWMQSARSRPARSRVQVLPGVPIANDAVTRCPECSPVQREDAGSPGESEGLAAGRRCAQAHRRSRATRRSGWRDRNKPRPTQFPPASPRNAHSRLETRVTGRLRIPARLRTIGTSRRAYRSVLRHIPKCSARRNRGARKNSS
jgi:hypothetical protein